mgnify:CR=1 FL=1
MTLTNKTVLVTGSTSGIGLGIARGFAEVNANVILNGFGDAEAIEAERAMLDGLGSGRRRHSKLGYQSPIAFEERATQT